MATIMLCDDASFMRMTLLKILEPAGHKVIGQAENGAEAIKLYKELKPEIVLMDITMPEVDGIEATKKIKEYDPDEIDIDTNEHEYGWEFSEDVI